ncbi:MAG TPA: nitrilase-related carbon-nitrogen hydrolase [Candidatus Paceibacterota bacterium]|nr:nitrilase-related carbon-nitrogen hydrolase [Candidatus Paceibacterota bacterium]
MVMSLVFAAASGVLLALALPPFSAPLFSLMAFAPVVFVAARRAPIPAKHLFVAGFIAGALPGASLSAFIFTGFAWPSDAPFVLELIHCSPVLWALLFGCVGGGCIVLYRAFRFDSILLNAALFAGAYVTLESALQWVTGHYYLGALAYTTGFLPASFAGAALGGEALVSFTVALAGALAGELLAAPRGQRRRALALAAYLALAAWLLCFAHERYLGGAPAPREMRVAVVQAGPRDALPFANVYQDRLTFPALAAALREAGAQGNELVVYPAAVANEVAYEGAPPADGYGELRFFPRRALDDWMRENAPASSTVVTWDLAYRGGEYFQTYHFWHSGTLAAAYDKRNLFAFTEYAPAYASFGFGPTPAPLSAGTGSGVVELESGVVAASLQCSEIHLAGLARRDAKGAGFFLNMGFEWILPEDAGEAYSLTAARYRAAENNIPAVRASIEGPSALIDARGAVVKSLGFRQQGLLQGTLEIPEARRATLYSLAGSYPLYAAIAALFLAAYARKKNIRFPGTRG